MIDERLKRYEPFFGKWRISDRLGKGAFGEVYEIYWDDGMGSRTKSAMKFMHIPSEEALKNQIDVQPNMDAVRNFFAGQLERVKDEVRILQKCKGHSNIVSLEDYLVVENPGREGVGWDVLIRMELLYPIVGNNGYFADPHATQLDVIRMWMHITNALIYCERPDVDIIHRDIKPTNIMVSDTGMFKLSDFGAARKNLQGQDASTRIGTEQYMAPEVYKGKKYDKRADYYSLGVVIYYYLNGSRRPFMPPYYEQMDHNQMVMADEKRIYGKSKIPEIPYVSRQVNRILLKCLAYKPQDRYKSAAELYGDLEKLVASQDRDLAQKLLSNPQEGGSTASLPMGWIIAAGILFAGGTAGLIFGLLLKPHSRQKTLSLAMNERVLDSGYLEGTVSDLVLSGNAGKDSSLVVQVNDQTEYVEADGSWEFVIAGSPLEEAFEENADNVIRVYYEDKPEIVQEIAFFAEPDPAQSPNTVPETGSPETVPDAENQGPVVEPVWDNNKDKEKDDEDKIAESTANSEAASQEASEKARKESEEAAQKAAEKESKEQSEAESRKESEAESREQSEADSQAESERESRVAAGELSKQQAESEQARKESERASEEASEKARKESEKASEAASEKARKESEKASEAASEKARKESEKASEEASEKARQESEKARRESEKAQQESEKARQESEKASEEASEKARQESEKASEEASEKARQESEKASEEASEKAAEDDRNIEAARKAIEELPESITPDEEHLALVTAAEQAVAVLGGDESLISRLAKETGLDDPVGVVAKARNDYDAAKKAYEEKKAEDERKVNAAKDAIEALPDTITAEDEAKVISAEEALGAVSGDESLMAQLREALGGADADPEGIVAAARAAYIDAITPKARYFDVLESPREGSKTDKNLDIFGTVLASEAAGNTVLYGDIVQDQTVVKSGQIYAETLKEKELERNVQKYAADIVAAYGYSLLDRISVEDLADGDYTFVLRAVSEDGTEEAIASVGFTKGDKAMSQEQIKEHEAEFLTQTDQEVGYLYHSDHGYTIGLDQDNSASVQANAGQIILTGWINAPSSTAMGLLLKIDGSEHTFGDITETMGGSAELVRTSRYLEGMTDEQRGGPAQNDQEGGWILNMNIPSLSEGDHDIQLIFNVTSTEQEYINMSPVKVHIDNSISTEEGKAERIAQEWKNQFPQPVVETSSEKTEGNS